MSKNGCFRASKSGHIGKRQKLGRRRKVIKEQERWGTGTRNRPIIIHDITSCPPHGDVTHSMTQTMTQTMTHLMSQIVKQAVYLYRFISR